MFSAKSISLPGRAAVAPSWLSRDKAAGLADRHCPHRPPAGPQVGSQSGSPGEARRGKGNTSAISASVEIFGPGTKSWADTSSSAVSIDSSGAAPGGAAKQQFPEA
jgi:hypothetical protein